MNTQRMEERDAKRRGCYSRAGQGKEARASGEGTPLRFLCSLTKRALCTDNQFGMDY